MVIAVITVEPAVKYSFVFKKYANELGSISAALSSPVFVLAGSFSRIAAGNRAYK